MGLALAVGLPFLQACGDDGSSSDGKVTESIKDGLTPEAGPLRILDYDAYVSPDIVTAFENKYGVKVEITTFTTDDEAITKIASGAVDVDLHKSAGTSTLFKLIESGLIQPLNKTYLTNLGNVVASLRDPYYDKGGTYSVPYTVFGTGIGFRADRLDPASVSWETLWNPEYKGVTSVLDDFREGLGMAMMRKGLTDVNTSDPAVIKQAGDDLGELTNLMNIKVEIEGYHTIPEGSTTVAHTWSGDMIGALQYLPEGTTSDVLGYWQPDPGRDQQRRDGCARPRPRTRCSLTSSSTTCSTRTTAIENFKFVGYQPAIDGVDGQYLIDQGLVPENLRSSVMSNDQIAAGLSVPATLHRCRGALGRRLVEVHSRRLIDGQRCGRCPGWPSQRILGVSEPAGRRLAGRAVRRSRSMPSPRSRSVSVDPILRTADPVWSPLSWDFSAMGKVFDRVLDPDDLGGAFIRTLAYVGGALVLCCLVGYPVAYYVARHARRWRGLLLVALVHAVLDQLPHADVGVGQPAAGRRLRQHACSVGCTSVVHESGSMVIGRPSSSGSPTATSRSSSCRCTPRSNVSTDG